MIEMRKLFLFLLLFASCFGFGQTTRLTLPQIFADWNTTSVPRGAAMQNTFYTLFNPPGVLSGGLNNYISQWTGSTTLGNSWLYLSPTYLVIPPSKAIIASDSLGEEKFLIGSHGGVFLGSNLGSIYSPFLWLSRNSFAKFSYNPFNQLLITSGGVLQTTATNQNNAIATDSAGIRSAGLYLTDTTGTIRSNGAYAFSGLQYYADYSSHYGNRSLIDKGYASSTFQTLGSYITSITGDGTASGPGSSAFTLATVNGNVGTFGDLNHSLVVTENGKGLTTAISSVLSNSFYTASRINDSMIVFKNHVAANNDTLLFSSVSPPPDTIILAGYGFKLLLSGLKKTGMIDTLSGTVSGSRPATQFYVNSRGFLTTISGITAGGDLSGTYPNPTVSKINGNTVPSGAVTGDILYASASNAFSRLAIGSGTQILGISGGIPAWIAAPATSPLTTKGDLYTYSTTNARLGIGADATILMADAAQTTGNKWIAPSGDFTIATNGVTTASSSIVKSVVLNTTGVLYTSPVTFTTSGGAATGSLVLVNQSAHKALLGPSGGSATTPTFRSIYGNDLNPIIDTTISHSGGGANKLTYFTSANALAGLSTANNGVLVTDGSGVPSIGSTIGNSISITPPAQVTNSVSGAAMTVNGHSTWMETDSVSSNSTAWTASYSNILVGEIVTLDYFKTTASDLVVTFPAGTIVGVLSVGKQTATTMTIQGSATSEWAIIIQRMSPTRYWAYYSNIQQ
jgi:hypothetical protein